MSQGSPVIGPCSTPTDRPICYSLPDRCACLCKVLNARGVAHTQDIVLALGGTDALAGGVGVGEAENWADCYADARNRYQILM